MDAFIKDKIKLTYETLEKLSEKVVYEVPKLKCLPCDYKDPMERPDMNDDRWYDFTRQDFVQGRDTHYWFYTEIETPSKKDNERLVLELNTGHDDNPDCHNPQGLLFLNGKIVQGFDLNHRQAQIEPDTKYEVLIYFYMGWPEHRIDVCFDVKAIDIPVKELYYDLKVPYEAAMCFDEKDYNHIKTIKYLEQTCNKIDFRNPASEDFYKSIKTAKKYLDEEYFKKICGNSDVVVSYIGHTHIDVAWLWILDQTREKTQRSFATVLSLMDRYPEYIFMSSQPQLYEYIKEEEPEIYERMKERIKEGRWEVEGAMWLEADCNITSGESLVRQIMHGKKFIKDEFDIESKILWLPDVFGYSAALPQILKKSGVDKFVTSKISWCETNRIPYDAFMWQGIDGSEIFTYFITAQKHEDYLKDKTYTTYIGNVTPQMNLGTWERFQQKEYNNEVLVAFGYGDGGGGPTEEMLEYERRLEYGLPGMPKAQISRAGDFLDRVKKNFDENCLLTGRIPKWVGELYLEFHRGTYTSIASIKKLNRQCEYLCQDTETLSVADKILFDGQYPKEELYKSWRTILLNQFHDIIPGSSISEVCDESVKQYTEVKDRVSAIEGDKLKNIASNVSKSGVLVYNPNCFTASSYVKLDDELIYAENIPPMGWKVIDKKNGGNGVIVTDKSIENAHYIIKFDDNMNIKSIYDKDYSREVIEDGKSANQLKAFEDYPRQYDNWEITNYYKQKVWEINDVSSVASISGSGFGGFEIVRSYSNSKICQRVIVYENSRRIDVENKVDWHEHHTLLKAVFPTTIHSTRATYDIQFGNLERPTHENTSWDKAKFEVCAHNWADISEDNYGVSILNNCKYGYSTLENEMTITLIKCGTFPNPVADQGIHEYTYSIYPHNGGFAEGKTVREAYLLNRPFKAMYTDGNGNAPSEYSLVSCDKENVVVETVKLSEDGKGIIIRMFDVFNRKTDAKLEFGFDAKKVYTCDLMENKIEQIGSGSSVDVKVKNFEIVTLYVEI